MCVLHCDPPACVPVCHGRGEARAKAHACIRVARRCWMTRPSRMAHVCDPCLSRPSRYATAPDPPCCLRPDMRAMCEACPT
eukprot:6320520-Alexandrium_andersonii.AAC.1